MTQPDKLDAAEEIYRYLADRWPTVATMASIIREKYADREDKEIDPNIVLSLRPKSSTRYVAIKADVYKKQRATTARLVEVAEQSLKHLKNEIHGGLMRDGEALEQAIADAMEGSGNAG